MLERYYNCIIKFDLINKYSYVSLKKIPKVEKIIFNFGCKNHNFFEISSTLLFLELISQKQSSVTKAKKSNVLLKIRKGEITGCTVILKKSDLYHFFLIFVTNIVPNIKKFKGIYVSKKKLLKKGFSLVLNDFICFKELEKQFYLFSKLPPLNITFLLSNIKAEKELLYLLQSFKFPLLFKNK